MENVKRIASFEVDHDFIVPNVYVSRIDGDITTYDMRTRVPNAGDYMDDLTMHSLEHMFATYVRSGALASDVIYFGPMGCQTGFYLLVRNADNEVVLEEIKQTLAKIVAHSADMFGASRKECGNYKNLSLDAAKREAASYLAALEREQTHFVYPKG